MRGLCRIQGTFLSFNNLLISIDGRWNTSTRLKTARRIVGCITCLALSLATVQTALPESLALPARGLRENVDPSCVRGHIDNVVAALASLSMKENIERFTGTGAAARKLDSFEAEVSVDDGVEHYTGVRGKHRTYQHVNEIGGLWSFGEIVTMLRTTRDIIDSSDWDQQSPGADGEEGAADQVVITFRSPAASRRWFVIAEGRTYWIAFEGAVRMSRKTGEVERLTWSAGFLPSGSGLASVFWDVNFRPVSIAGAAFIMPSDSVYRVVRKGVDRTTEWNLTRYAALGRYGSTATIDYVP